MKTNYLSATIASIILYCGQSISAVPVNVNLSVEGNQLNALFFSTESVHPVSTILLLHGIPGNDSWPLDLAPALNTAGFNVMVFNYEGTYKSEGIFNFTNCMRDIDCALNWLRTPENINRFCIDTSRITVCGYSHGGSMVLTEACYNPMIRNIISISGPDQFVVAQMLTSDSLRRQNFENSMGKVFAPGGPIRLDTLLTFHEFVDKIIADKNTYDLKGRAQNLVDRRILFVTGWNDKLCTLELFVLPLYRQLCELGAKQVSITAMQTDHSYSNVRNDLAELIINWLQ